MNKYKDAWDDLKASFADGAAVLGAIPVEDGSPITIMVAALRANVSVMEEMEATLGLNG